MLAIVAPGFAGAVEGEQVVSGEATFTRDGSLTLITTGTPQTIVNYTSFDIGLGETVRIDQPDATSRILNNVLSTDPTLINGVLTSNGQVWIANPVGVFFGDQAIVDVGRLVAGAGKVDAAEFIAGVERWSELTGRVEVASGAQIRAADSVLLVGAAVANYGNISAADGMIALVAGGEVRFRRVDGRVMVTADRALAPDPERWGVTQAGTLDAGHGSVSLTAGDAYSLAINHTGITRASDIAVAGGDGGVVSVSGALDASDRSAGATGGAIAVTGDRVALLGAQLDASGDAGGGSIRVGGDLRGEGELPTAQRTYVDHNSSLRADAISTGDGGTIIVWSDEATRFYGALSARGGALGGDGGFAEISGASLESRGSIDLGAAAGSAGTLLYDPKEIEIVGGTATGPDGSDSPDTLVDNVAGDGGAGQILFADLGDLSAPFRIYESEIEGTNANVVLEATHRIDSSGTFDHDAAGEGIGVVQIMNGNSLTLRTRNDADDATDATDPIAGIDLTGVSFQTTGSGAITLATGTGSDTGVQADIHVGNFTTAGGAVTASTEGGDITVANVTTSSTGDTGAAGGNVTLAAGGTGSVTAGSIHALGGTSTTGDGGRGGNVAISALNGSIDVGEIDVSGGDGTAHLVDDGHGGQIGAGQGGSGGTINLVADIDPQSTAAAVPGDPREITVTGDLSARGGRGLGTATSAGTVYGAAGGTGGQILISAGTRAAEAGAGSIVLGSAAVPIEIDASGGHGTARGGSAAAGGTSALTGATIDAIRIEANDDVTAHAVLAATGGFAGIDASSAVGLPPGGFDPTAAPKLGPGGFGGSGGNVSIESKDGNVTLNDVPSATAIVVLDGGAGRSGAPVPNLSTGAFHFDGQGGSAGSLTVAVAGASRATPTDPFVGNSIVVNGPVSALGGAGTNGAGGAGGSMTLTAADGGVTFAAADPGVTIADLRGGSGTGSVSFTRTDGVLVEQEVRGGNGGGVFLTANAATGTDAAGGGNVVFTGTVDSTGGDAFLANGTTPNPPNDGTGGTVRLTSAKAITARVGDARVDNFEVVVSKVAGTVDVLGDGIDADGSGSASTHTITNLVTTADSPHFTYRLADGGSGAADEVDINTLAVGNATLGAQGVTIANARADATASDGERLLGKIQGVAGTQVNTAGKLQLFATNIGDATPLSVAGTGGTLEVTVVGNIGRLDDSQSIRAAGLVLDMPGSTVDVTQRSAAGDTVIDFPGGDADDVVIDGSVVDDGASRTETSLVKEVTTTAGTGFFYTLANPTASADDAGRAEPKLRIARGAVKLGGDVGFATIGDLILESAAEPTADPGTAIVANGHSVSLTADADGDGGGAIIASTRGETDVADATKLVALAGSGVGSATELRTSGASAVELIGRTKTGDFHVVHTGTGALTIIPLATDEDGVPSGGVQATTGDVVLSDAAGGITLGGAQPAGVTSPVAHVLSGGDQDYTGALRVAAASVTTAGTTVSGAALRAGGKIDFVDAITADALGRSLEITAGGTTTFAGDVGTSSTPLGALKVSDALFAGDRSVWLGSRGDFQAINGTGLLALNASETDSELVFRGDIGVAGDFLANADLLSFDDNANHIAAGSVSLNTAPPATRAADRFQFATIADSSGGLVIEGTREVTMGAGEKLSSAGPLVIHAGTDASLGDLSATELSVDAPTIKILGRAPGPVALANGVVVQDFGVDWVANNITTNVVPQWDEEPGTTRPTFVLGSGGIRTGGIIPFDVIRFTSDGDKIRPSSFTGSNDRTLDLTGLGPRAVSDARSDVPRATPPVLPGLAARAGDEPPSPPREISSDELIGALHCRTAAGDPCAPPAVGDDPLASERALEIRQRYRALLADDQAQQSLRAAFAPAASVSAGDAAALSRALAHDPALGAARARVADLAVALAQVELLGLGAPESERARRSIAADFAAATGVAGLDADAVLAAVDASGVAVLP